MNKNSYTVVVDQIKAYFPEMEISPSNLKVPTKDFVLYFFNSYFEELCIDLYDVMAPTSIQHQGDSHPIMFQDILPYVNASNFIREFLLRISSAQSIASEPFGVSDIINPNPTRTMAFLTLAMNFFDFSNSCLATVHKRCTVIDERKENVSQLISQRELLKTQVNQRAACMGQSSTRADQIKTKKKQINELEEEIKSINVFTSNRQAEHDEIREKVTHLQESVFKLKEVIRELEQQLVASPDAIKSEHRHLEQKFAESELKLQDATKNFHGKKDILFLLEKVEKAEDLKQSVLSEVIDVAKKVRNLKTELTEQIQASQNVRTAIVAHESTISKLCETLSNREGLTINLQLQWEKKKSGLEENLRHQREEKANLESKHGDKLQMLRRSYDEKNAVYQDLKATHKHLCEEYSRLHNLLKEQHKRLLDKKKEEYNARLKDIQSGFSKF